MRTGETNLQETGGKKIKSIKLVGIHTNLDCKFVTATS